MIDIWVIYFNLSCADILGAMKRVVPDGKDITMDSFLYRLYVHLWRDCYPLRMFLLPGKSLLSRHLRKQSQLMHLEPVSPPALKIVLCQGDGALDTHDNHGPDPVTEMICFCRQCVGKHSKTTRYCVKTGSDR